MEDPESFGGLGGGATGVASRGSGGNGDSVVGVGSVGSGEWTGASTSGGTGTDGRHGG